MTNDELRRLFDSIIKPSGHPDPVGYLARAVAYSDADPNYIDMEGNIGFMPVHPDRAMREVGASTVVTLESNIAATLAMDMQYFQTLQSVNDMIVAFHEGLEAVGNPSKAMRELLSNLPELRQEMLAIVSPRRATVNDVIRLLTKKNKMHHSRLEAFKEILRGA